jgi:SAM-dependent methyltransferase
MESDLDRFYDAFPRIEEEFNSAVGESLDPRGPELLYELVGSFGLPRGAAAIDVGCGEGSHALRLASEFGLRVVGVDPVARHVDIATAATPTGVDAIFRIGSIEALPVDDASIDLVWCRDVLVHVADLDAAFREMRRVLRPTGRAVLFVTFDGDTLEPREADWLQTTMHGVAKSMDRESMEAAIMGAGLRVAKRVDLAGEWGEWAEERTARGTGRLLAAARLLRDPDRYVGRFGREAYDIMLGDCLSHVYGMIGKLTSAAYELSVL